MNRAEALAMANMIVGEWLDPPKNQRGYPVDGWKPTGATERATIVVQLADFLREPPTSKLVAPPLPSPTLFGWPIDGSAGRPSEQQYKAAIMVRDDIANHNRPVPTRDVEALVMLIEAYERGE